LIGFRANPFGKFLLARLMVDYAHRNSGLCSHVSCTCMMESYAIAVVDYELRERGLDELQIIDAR
jgi:hypothetical protein